MDKATRPGPDARQLAENLSDIHPPLDKFQAKTAAAECLYCYEAPCTRACPTSIDIPTFIHKISTDNPLGAAKTILAENILGGTCARACPTEVLCEEACVRNTSDGAPVEIGRLQRFAVDHLIDRPTEEHPFDRAPDTGRRVAVVGAGPAGLACAHRLAMLGHQVDIFEAMPKPGGLNEYGLAAYKMTQDFAQREVKFVQGIGNIEIHHGVRLGEDLPLSALQTSHDAVFIGVGLGSSNDLGFTDLPPEGIEDALTFIERLRQSPEEAAARLPERVTVIGGGNTAIDAAVQARKLGAREVTLCYRRGRDEMSATGWEQDLALKNDVKMILWAMPVKVLGKHQVKGLALEHSVMSEDGRLISTGEKFEIETDLILTAIGQKLHRASLGDLELAGGKITIDAHYQTSLPGVFAGGDCTATGEDLTVQAVEDGKRAAHAIHDYLSQ
ncbi:MAG: NAD(P)-dependent oxidoreductase [Alphaproteobacteria bacterium]|nr:MAG: NAD(P)-dependent oxidoreductase [Alphaproteobacteria bacterium]